MIDRARVEFDHNRLLKKVAKEVFSPLGLVQRGSSRTWFDDHGWWVITVTFDASGFGKGSYLKVASSPLWEPVDHVALAHEYRDRWEHPHAKFGTTFIEARRPDWWERDVRILSDGAAHYVGQLREAPHDVRTFLELERHGTGGKPVDNARSGIPAGLLGMDVEARDGLADLEGLLAPHKWTDATTRMAWDEWVHERIEDLKSAVGDRSTFLGLVADNVARLRASQKLPFLPTEGIARDLDAYSRS